MSVLRENLWWGQSRADVPQLRSTDASADGDWDAFAGLMVSGTEPLIVYGFQVLTSNIIGADASTTQIATANSLAMHYLASESGTIFSVPADRPVETLNASNPLVTGSFTANAVNFVGFDLRRTADSTTADVLQFLDPITLLKTPKRVALARTLNYQIFISAQDFSLTPGICPIARITTDLNNNVIAIEDARNIFGRLGSGGSVPNEFNAYSWPGGRTEAAGNTSFTNGDKAIQSLKQWMDAAMTRIWEIGGGEEWFSATADRNVEMVRTGSTFSNGEFFSWTGSVLSWQGISFVFDNSTGYRNDVAAGSVALPDGWCLYVDLDRTENHLLTNSPPNPLTAQIAPLTTLGTPVIPGSRWIMAWRVGSGNFCIFTRDSSFPVNSSFLPATNTSLGIVKLNYASATAPAPVVVLANSVLQAVATGLSRGNNAGGGTAGPGAITIGNDATNDTSLSVGSSLAFISSFNGEVTVNRSFAPSLIAGAGIIAVAVPSSTSFGIYGQGDTGTSGGGYLFPSSYQLLGSGLVGQGGTAASGQFGGNGVVGVAGPDGGVGSPGVGGWFGGATATVTNTQGGIGVVGIAGLGNGTGADGVGVFGISTANGAGTGGGVGVQGTGNGANSMGVYGMVMDAGSIGGKFTASGANSIAMKTVIGTTGVGAVFQSTNDQDNINFQDSAGTKIGARYDENGYPTGALTTFTENWTTAYSNSFSGANLSTVVNLLNWVVTGTGSINAPTPSGGSNAPYLGITTTLSTNAILSTQSQLFTVAANSIIVAEWETQLLSGLGVSGSFTVGLNSSNSFTDGIWITQIGTGNIALQTLTSSVANTVSTSTSLSTTSLAMKLEIYGASTAKGVANGNQALARLWINGTLVATSTSHVPTGTELYWFYDIVDTTTHLYSSPLRITWNRY